MRHRAFWVRFFLVASLATAAMIFWFSAQKGVSSQAMSDGVTLRAARIVRPDFEQLPPETRQSFLESLSVVIRKSAHFLEFALLGFNLAGFYRLRRQDRPSRAALGASWLTGTLYAITDELHQLFVNERAAAVLDVAIDSAGTLAGALVALAVLMLVIKQ